MLYYIGPKKNAKGLRCNAVGHDVAINRCTVDYEVMSKSSSLAVI
jgi:hypothetical protein